MDVNCTGTIDCYGYSKVGTTTYYGALSPSDSTFSPAYGTNTGWDYATGIGSVNAYNLIQNWTKVVTTTGVTSNASASLYGQSVTFTATITPAIGSGETGTVTWSANTGCAASTVSSGVATCTTTSLPPGTNTITGTYSGDGNFSTSAGTLSGGQVVNQANTLTTVLSSLNPSTFGQAVSFTASVAAQAPGGGTPAGTVQFAIDGSNFGTPVTLASGSATSGSTSTLAVGTHTVTAAYAGGTDFTASTGTLSGGQVFNSGSATTITLTPTSLAFGSIVESVTSAAKSVTLKNTGSATLNITSIVVSGDFALATSTSPCGSTLAAGKTCVIKVTFTPLALGVLSGSITITDNASGSPQTVPLTGTGTVQTMLTPATATYMAQKVGTTSAAKVFTLANKQPVPLTSIVISTTGDFTVSTTTCTTSLAAKASCKISVVFTPTATGARTGTLQVADSATGSPQTSSLKGTGK